MPTEDTPPVEETKTVIPDNTDIDGAGSPAPDAPSNVPPKAPEAPSEAPKEGVEDANPKEPEAPADPDAPTEPVTDVELDTTVWGDTGSEVGNSTLALLQDAGVDVSDAKALLFDAIQDGDVTKIDAAALEEKVGKARATLIMAGVNGFIKETNDRVAAINTQVYDAAGGEDNWNTMIDWARASNVDLSEYASLIEAGGAQARFAVSEIKAKYDAVSTNTPIVQTQRAEPSAVATPAVQAITRAEYVTQLAAAHRTGNQREIDRIQQARNAGRKLGI